VLIHGAGGGVGTALLQLGKLAQLALYGTASAAKHEKLSSLGAQLIDHHHEDFVGRIRELTGGSGVRAAFDPIGGRNLWRSYRCLARGGTLLSYGVSAMTRKGGLRGCSPLPGRFSPSAARPGTGWQAPELLLDPLVQAAAPRMVP